MEHEEGLPCKLKPPSFWYHPSPLPYWNSFFLFESEQSQPPQLTDKLPIPQAAPWFLHTLQRHALPTQLLIQSQLVELLCHGTFHTFPVMLGLGILPCLDQFSSCVSKLAQALCLNTCNLCHASISTGPAGLRGQHSAWLINLYILLGAYHTSPTAGIQWMFIMWWMKNGIL